MKRFLGPVVKYETQLVPVYLFHYPVIYWDYFCSECNNRRLAVRWQGAIKLRDKKIRVGLSAMELTNCKYLSQMATDWLFKESFFKGKLDSSGTSLRGGK